MTSMTLEKLVRKEIRSVLSAVLQLVDEPILILDADGNLLLGTPGYESPGESGGSVGGLPSPIEHNGQIMGWVAGRKGSKWPASMASMLAFLLDQEAEKKD